MPRFHAAPCRTSRKAAERERSEIGPWRGCILRAAASMLAWSRRVRSARTSDRPRAAAAALTHLLHHTATVESSNTSWRGFVKAQGAWRRPLDHGSPDGTCPTRCVAAIMSALRSHPPSVVLGSVTRETAPQPGKTAPPPKYERNPSPMHAADQNSLFTLSLLWGAVNSVLHPGRGPPDTTDCKHALPRPALSHR